MYVEVSVAVNYLLSHLYTKLPRRRVDNFGDELQRCLMQKLQPHWLVDTTNQDVSPKYFQTSGPQADFTFTEAAMSSGLDWSEILACLPAGLVLSIDPGHVACHYGSSDSSPAVSGSTWGSGCGNSTGLSSSGHSSASSTSSNGSPGLWQMTRHQVLYSTNVKGSQSPQTLTSETITDVSLGEAKKNSEEVQTHLATETALSVLTEPEEFQSANTREYAHGLSRENARTNADSTSDVMASPGQIHKHGERTSMDPTRDIKNIDLGNNDLPVRPDIEDDFHFNEFQNMGGRRADSELDSHLFDYSGVQAHQTQKSQATNFSQKSTPTPSYTAATFAATKFGSTKLKSQTKRPHRIAPACDAPVAPYPAQQILDTVMQPPLSLDQDGHRGAPGTFGPPNLKGHARAVSFFGNCASMVPTLQQIDRSNNTSYKGSSNGYSCGLVGDRNSGVSGLGNSGYGIRSSNMLNSPVWSQFEKIRSEFQMKNNHLPYHQRPSSMFNRSIGQPYADSYKSNILGAIGRNTFQQDLLASSRWNNPDDSKGAYREDLRDINSFNWSPNVDKLPLDTAMGQAFNALNISER